MSNTLKHAHLCIGVDEAGRGPGLGPVYTAAVVWPADLQDVPSYIRDSKKLSPQKLEKAHAYVLENALAYSVHHLSSSDIDNLGILKANMLSMNHNIREIMNKLPECTHALIDGNYFDNQVGDQLTHETVVKGDDKYYCIAAASILAKYSRDQHIYGLCDKYPELDSRYGIRSNRGYLSSQHTSGLKKYGFCQFHRSSWKNFEGLVCSPVTPLVRKKPIIIKKISPSQCI